MPSKQAKRREAAKLRDRAEMSFRGLSVRAESINADARTVDTVIATETPVTMFDWERWEMIPEVLRADGAILPAQVPFLDNHNRFSTVDQLGSARNIRQEKSEIVGQLRFSTNAEAQWNLVREGHITDVSAGYQVLERTFVPKGDKAVIRGREYVGPVNVVTKWKLREVSLTPIGADEQAKLRGFDPSAIPSEEVFRMNEELRALLESRGMPKDLSDDEARQEWLAKNLDKLTPPPEPERKEKDPAKGGVREAGDDFEARMAKMIADALPQAARQAIEEQRKAESQRKAIIATVGRLVDIDPRELGDKLDSCNTREEIEKAFLDFKAERQQNFPTVPVFSGPQQVEKLDSSIRTELVMRCLTSVGTPEPLPGEPDGTQVAERREKALESLFPKEKRSKDATFRNATLFDMARTFVEQHYGVRSLDYSREEIAVMALFGYERAAETYGFSHRSPAYHTTGSFANLTLDAMNKSMMMGYTEAPSTWERVMRVGADAADFKSLHRLRLGSIPNIPVWPDNTSPEEISLKDARETYAVEARSAEISFSYRLLVNDDMDALSRVPGMYGSSFRRTLNKYAWSIITSNPTMSDGQALFSAATGNRKHQNLTTGAGAPSTTTLQALTALMMRMTGENTPEQNAGEDILALMPRYIVGPVALRTTILQLVLSVYDPASTASALLYNMAAGLIPIIEPLLDSHSTTAWYLFADTSQIDTVEISFLRGQRSPVTRQELDVKTLSQKVYALQTWGGAPMNYRGIQKHAGA